ncbi:hypothetical protein MRX96_016999 [Rhipicephalus microplus]
MESGDKDPQGGSNGQGQDPLQAEWSFLPGRTCMSISPDAVALYSSFFNNCQLGLYQPGPIYRSSQPGTTSLESHGARNKAAGARMLGHPEHLWYCLCDAISRSNIAVAFGLGGISVHSAWIPFGST